MKILYDTNGRWTTIHDGTVVGPGDLNPKPQDFDWNKLVEQYTRDGAVIYSSQWVGWTPVDSCGSNGNLDGSFFCD